MGNGEQGDRRREEEWIGTWEEDHSKLLPEGRQEGRSGIGFTIQVVAIGRRPQGRCDPAAESGREPKEHEQEPQPVPCGQQPEDHAFPEPEGSQAVIQEDLRDGFLAVALLWATATALRARSLSVVRSSRTCAEARNTGGENAKPRGAQPEAHPDRAPLSRSG
jgi:hypothetical protein